MNLKIFCRICLEAPNALQKLNLDEVVDEERELSYRDCLNILTGIQLPENDEKPENLCFTCGEELKISYNFHKKIKDANKVLAEMKINVDEIYLPDESSATSTITITIEKDDEQFKLEDSLDINSMSEHFYIDAMDTEENLNTEMKMEFIEVEDRKCVQLENEVRNSPIYNAENQPTEEIEENSTHTDTLNHMLGEAEKEEILPSEKLAESIQKSTDKSTDKSIRKGKQKHKKSHKCDFCDKVFPNNSRLVQHMSCHDPARPRYPCFECHRMYATKAALDAHKKIVHEKKGFVCPYCEKIFAIKKGLEIHMRYHTGDFPYSCMQCEKKFAQICHLNTHIKVIHNNKRFTCEHPNCSKVFTNSASLRNHEFSHGEKPFKCEFCRNEYPCKAKLKVHIRRKHDREMTLEELEGMRQFYNQRSRLKMVQVAPIKTET